MPNPTLPNIAGANTRAPIPLRLCTTRTTGSAEWAHDPDSLDVSDLKDRLRQAEGELERAEDDSERRRVAERDKRRWERFIEIAESS